MNTLELLTIDSKAVCPFQESAVLDVKFRRAVQNPAKFLRSFITKGMNVLDLGCGTGFCTFDIANLLQGEGNVTAADLQPQMLDVVKKRAEKFAQKELITFHQCKPDAINCQGKTFDFILLFYMFHEMPDKTATLAELKSLLKTNGKILIVEPMLHVNRNLFNKEVRIVCENGFSIISRPKIFFSRAMLLQSVDQ